DPAAVLRFANRYGWLSNDPAGWSFQDGWCRRIAEMRDLVALADAVTAADLRALQKLLPDHESPAALGSAAVSQLGRVLETRILEPGLTLRSDWSPHCKRIQVCFEHVGLHSFMFFQLAQSVLNGKQYRRCEGCRRWFELAPRIGRADKAACSPSC